MNIPDSPEERIARARALVESDARGAFLELRSVLAWPSAPEGEILREALDVMHRVAEELVGDHLAGVIGWARDHLDDPEALYDAGYALYEQKLHDLAATLLGRANTLSPGSPTVVTELAANLEALMAHEAAAAALRGSGLVETDPMCAYLYGFNSLLCGDVEAARPIVMELRGATDTSLSYMGAALAGMVARADAVRGATRLDDHDLAGWHLVINGGALLHLSPHGYDEPMCGRYAYVSDGYPLLREGLTRLRIVLAAAEIEPPRVFALPDRSSRVVALAAARILGVPCEPWPAGGDDRPGVIAAYDLDRVGAPEVLEQLHQHRAGQVLFAHASCWTDPFPFTPDVTTFLYQAVTAPWDGGQMSFDPDHDQVERSEVDAAPEEALAARVIEADARDESVSSREELAALVKAARAAPGEAAAGLHRSGGARLRQRAGSPVKSARFL